jgi:hypothetical protein
MINDTGNQSIQKEVSDMVTYYRSKSHMDCLGTEVLAFAVRHQRVIP